MSNPPCYPVQVVFEQGSPEGVEQGPSAGQQGPSAGQQQHVQNTSVWADSLLLRARSHYFHAALTFNESQDTGETAKRRRTTPRRGRRGGKRVEADGPDEAATKVLKLTYQDAGNLEAGKNIIQMLHDLALPPASRTLNLSAQGTTPSLILRMLRWADYLGSPECAEACIDLLPNLQQAELQLTEIKNLLSLPLQIAPATSFEKVERFCSEWLQRALGDAAKVKQFSSEDVNHLCSLPADVLAKVAPTYCEYLLSHFSGVHAVIVGAELLDSFCKLEYALVKMWASQDRLMVHSENDVAILLTLRCTGKSLSQEQSEKLSSLLRVSRLSRSFRCFFLPRCAWFSPPFEFEVFNGMLDEDGVSKIPKVAGQLGGFPSAWIAQGRCGVLPAGATKRSEFTACFSGECLSSMLKEAEVSNATSSLLSDLFYFGGFYWRLKLQLSMPRRSLGVYLILDGKHPFPSPPAARVTYSLYHQGNEQDNCIGRTSAWINGRMSCAGASAYASCRWSMSDWDLASVP